MAKNEKTIKIFEKLREIFNLTKEHFADCTLTDGSILRSEGDMIEGAKVSLVGADGTVTAVPDGDLVLSDGTKITVKSGVIATLIAPAAPAEATPTPADATAAPEAPAAMDATPAETAPAAESVPTDAPAATEEDSYGDLAAVADAVNQLASRVAALENALNDAMTANTEMSKKLEAFAATPAATPVKRKEVTEEVFGKQSKENYFSRIEALGAFRKSITK